MRIKSLKTLLVLCMTLALLLVGTAGSGGSSDNSEVGEEEGLEDFPDVVEAKATVIQGIRDEHWRVRQEAIRTVKENDNKDAVPYLIYRAKNDSEKLIKEESLAALAALNTDEGHEFLISQLQDKKEEVYLPMKQPCRHWALAILQRRWVQQTIVSL